MSRTDETDSKKRSEAFHSLAVTIVSWNRCEELRLLLGDLTRQAEPADEIVIVDNGSVDDSVAMLEREFPDIRLIRLHKNTGLSFARNVAARATKADLIVSLDNDMRIPDRRFLHKVRASAAQHADCGVISFGLVWAYPAGTPAALRAEYELADLVALAERGAAPVPVRAYYDWFMRGGACVIRRSLFETIGWLDDEFAYGGEEWDFAYRCHAAGIRLLRDTGAWLVHAPSPKMRSKSATLLLLKGMTIAQARYMPLPDLLLFLILQFAKSAIDTAGIGTLGTFFSTSWQIAREWGQRVTWHRKPVGREVMQRFYFLRLNQTDQFAEVEKARTTALEFYRRRSRRDAPDLAEQMVIAVLPAENG